MKATVKVWDPLLRLFHWSLVASFAVAWLSAEEIQSMHIWAGYAAGALIGFRLLWGLVGPKYARFGQFVRSPKETKSYLCDITQGREKRYLGHNPAGGAMILALIAGLASTVFFGWLSITDAYWGVEWVEEVHEFSANVMLGLVVLHVCGVVLASIRHDENLAKAMWTGRKRVPSAEDVS
ncbi:cytochrome b/b6 domain-containing protein [Aestuariispira ectoiniformans]|uniref:cytochrome b/b6 domain-containing protein n=1 Tax=Aestuariispira ectoiniformans TaxID=2775080 RepID=UPI0021E41852|nr:cytochrome b/b6 domain-containing protein [Aestuariispira ectoiniformans]